MNWPSPGSQFGALLRLHAPARSISTIADSTRPPWRAKLDLKRIPCCLAVYGRAPLAAVLDALAKAAPARIALVKEANKRNQPPPPLGVARLGPLVLTDANPPN